MCIRDRLWSQEEIEETKFSDIIECTDPIAMDELLAVHLHCCKNRKSSGSDGLTFELIKYAPALLHDRLLNFIKLCWTCLLYTSRCV